MRGQSSRFSHALLWAAAALVSTACNREPAPGPASAILVTIDTTRADALSPYGAPSYVSPRLEALARECVRYTQARTVTPLTLPAHASMLTGLYPPRHGVRENGLCPLPPDAVTVSELAQEKGLATAAFVSALVLDRAFALDQGFDTYDQPERPAQQVSSHYVERPASETVERARAWMARRDRARGFFVWVHLYDPHVPYAPPAKFREQARGDLYRGEIAAADEALGAWLAELAADGTLAQTTLVITSDHGESLGEHGEGTHGAFCYDSTLRVPLLVRYPDARGGGTTEDGSVSLVDLAPTLAAALRLPAPASIDGASLFDRPPPPDRGVYCESYSGFLNYGWSPLSGWVASSGKYLHSSRPEFYELARDRNEARNTFPEPAAAVSAARDAIGRLLAEPALSATGSQQIPEALARDLRQLGYGASGTVLAEIPHPLAPSELAAPRDRAGELEPLLIANALLDVRNFAEAAPILAKLVAENPRHALGFDLYGFALLQLSRYEEAASAFARRARLGPARADTLTNWGVACEKLGRTDEARAHFEAALAVDPLSVLAIEGLLRLARERADPEALRALEAELERARAALAPRRG